MRDVGLGCMRLSTQPDRDDARSVDLLAEVLRAGVTLLDTADAYCLDHTDIGHNERLIARALATLPAEHAARIRVVTKGGLTRPDGAWVPDGRAKHLAAAARASAERLGRPPDVYLLHVIDPKTPFATSVRALAKLVADGVVRTVGLSNVNVTQLEEAERIVPIAAVEVELGLDKRDALHNGLVAACEQRGIPLLAYRPFGGARGAARLAKNQAVTAHATRLGITPAQLVLAWLRTLSPAIVPLPGASTRDHALAAARPVDIDDDARAALTDGDSAPRTEPATRDADIGATRDGDIVLLAGMPGAGKSTLAQEYVARGYLRFNRDERGGPLRDAARALDAALASGATRAVLDNTYATRAQRAEVLVVARKHRLPCRVVTLATPLERAQHNAVLRMLARHGRLLEPAELRGADIGPGAQFRYRREYEAPRADEGFIAIEEIAFAPPASPPPSRSPSPAPSSSRRAMLVELDDVVWRGRPRTVEMVALRDGAHDTLRALHARGYALAATSWQPDATPAQLATLVAAVRALLDVPLLVAACHHAAGPPVCWCRKPLPGLGLFLAHAHDLDIAGVVGTGAADRGFALRVGAPFHDVADGGWTRVRDLHP